MLELIGKQMLIFVLKHSKIYVTEILEKMDESKIFFGFDHASLSEVEKAKIRKVAQIVKENKIDAVKIVGFTDKIGSAEYNNELSLRRANAVKAYLGTLVTLKSSKVEMRALGKTHPIKECPNMERSKLIECLAPNRRVEIEVDYF